MIVLAAVAVGFAANAASYTWTTGGRIFNGTGGSGSANYITGVTAYLMFESVVSASDLVSSYSIWRSVDGIEIVARLIRCNRRMVFHFCRPGADERASHAPRHGWPCPAQEACVRWLTVTRDA